MMSRYHDHIWERDRLLDLYPRARGEERVQILAKLVVLDEEAEQAFYDREELMK